MKHFLAIYIVFLCASYSFGQTNLLFVFTDQQSYDMVGYHEGSQAITPMLDSLAHNGMYFSHSVSNTPVCTPMRGMLMSGQHPLYNGAWKNDVPLLPNNGTTFPQALNNAGYETAYIGKWHLYGGGHRDQGVPPGENRHGFNSVFLSDNVTTDFRAENSFYWNDQGEKVFFKDEYEDNPWELEAQTRQAEEWLNNYDSDDPFALFISWHPPHNYVGDGCEDVDGSQENYNVDELDPLLIDPYVGMEINLRPDIQNDEMAGCRQEQYRNYMAMITACDNSLKRLVDLLKSKGEFDNTLIVFTSDHGDMIGSHNAYMPKKVPQDYSVRVPLVMYNKEILPNTGKNELLVGSLDLMPTILGLLDVEVPDEVQGLDLSEFIIDGNEDAVESIPLFLYTGQGFRGVYTKEWTYSEQVGRNASGAPTNVLYNRENDKSQLDNLFNNSNYADVQEELAAMTYEWMDKFEDEGFDINDFNEIYELNEWKVNYSERPIDLLKALYHPVDTAEQVENLCVLSINNSCFGMATEWAVPKATTYDGYVVVYGQDLPLPDPQVNVIDLDISNGTANDWSNNSHKNYNLVQNPSGSCYNRDASKAYYAKAYLYRVVDDSVEYYSDSDFITIPALMETSPLGWINEVAIVISDLTTSYIEVMCDKKIAPSDLSVYTYTVGGNKHKSTTNLQDVILNSSTESHNIYHFPYTGVINGNICVLTHKDVLLDLIVIKNPEVKAPRITIEDSPAFLYRAFDLELAVGDLGTGESFSLKNKSGVYEGIVRTDFQWGISMSSKGDINPNQQTGVTAFSASLNNMEEIYVSPNPVSKGLRVYNAWNINGYKVVDLFGRTVLRSKKRYSELSMIDVSELIAGSYLLIIETERIQSLKFVKS